jgi:hypothetical protein
MALTYLTSLNSLTSSFAKVDVGILHYVYFECLLEIENDSAQINFIVWAFVARRIGSVCPRLVLLMPIRWSIRDHAVGMNFFNLFNFPFAKVGLMIDYLNNVE